MNQTYKRIYATVRAIPSGQVATYGQVARISGFGRNARLVGYALHALPQNSDVPWHRVINYRGEISLRAARGPYDDLQYRLLVDEGVVFDARGRIDLRLFQWPE